VTRQSIRQRWTALSKSDKTRALLVVLSLVVAAVLFATAIIWQRSDTHHDLRRTAGTWPEPELRNSETILLSADRPTLNLERDKDYRLQFPCDPLKVESGLSIRGGRNVVLSGGTIEVTKPDGARGLLLENQTGTVDVSDVHISGNLTEGIDLSQFRGATVQLQNILIDQVKGSRNGNHADLVQTWAGPKILRIDGLRGTSNYQGFFLTPNQRKDGEAPELFDLRNIAIKLTDEAGYALWRDDRTWPLQTQNVQVFTAKKKARDAVLWPKPSSGKDTWNNVTVATIDAAPEFTPTEAMRRCSN
jgi:hypothetical protein